MQRSLNLVLHIATVVAGILIGAAAEAEPVRAVVEMYTSQGCASCPPADRLVGDLSRQAGIVALTMPVTYWDYLGWKDNLAAPAFTDRQRAYAATRSERSLFTPQAVINGEGAMVGSDRSGVERGVSESRSRAVLVAMSTEERGDRILVDVAADSSGRNADLWLVPVMRSHPVAIASGENKGKVVIYTNVVRGMQRIGTWSGDVVHVEVPRNAVRETGADAYVVMLQSAVGGRLGRIVGAAKGPGL